MFLITKLNKKTKRNLRKYRNTKFNYSNFINEYYIDDDGYAYISTKVKDISDIISKHSIRDYEWVNLDYVEYVNNQAKYIPVGESILLEICGHKFSSKDEEMIKRVLKQYFGLKFGDSIIEKNINKRKALVLLIFGIISTLLFVGLSIFHITSGLISELIVFGLWFFIWEFLDLAILEASDLDNKSLKAAQLANIKIVFNENEK